MSALSRRRFLGGAAVTPAGHWVQGHMYDDTKFIEGRPMNRLDLDAVSTEHPVFILHRGGHTAVVNTKAFETAGLTSTTDAYGEREQWQAYQDAYHAGELNLRVSFMPSGGIYAAMKAAGIRSGFGDEMLRVGAVKYAADGSASERTMRMSTPYAGRPDDYGILTMNGAYASFEEDIKGSLTPGKMADIAVLAEDPHHVDADRIKHIGIVRTILGGRTMYEA